MRIVVLYHPASEFARSVEEYARDFERQKGQKIEMLSLETRDGAAMASLYDVVRYPAMLAVKEDGQVQRVWEGELLPLMNEVAGYINA